MRCFVAAKDRNKLWSKRYGSATDQIAADIATDGAGSVILVGRFTGTWTLGGITLSKRGRHGRARGENR